MILFLSTTNFDCPSFPTIRESPRSNYVLMEKIGAYGMDEVYKAEHRLINRIVAIAYIATLNIESKLGFARMAGR